MVNHSNDYPTIDDRALVYEGIKFLGAAAPSTPSFHSPYAAYNQNKIKFDWGGVFAKRQPWGPISINNAPFASPSLHIFSKT